ncbi:hypothetical protein HPB49_026031 [Dermacentor silvarum]|nr:hypothetical protein HPB49_026031 [Dermacentor silvarum]
MDVVGVEGETISPEEYEDPGQAHTRRKSRTKERSSIGDSLRNADETHRLATRRGSWRKRGTPAPRQPQLPEEDYKVVIRPRGGFDTMQSSPIIKDGVLRAAGITIKDAEEDILRVNSKQNTFIMSTRSWKTRSVTVN